MATTTAGGLPSATEGGSHACELKPEASAERVRLSSGMAVREVRLPEIPFLPILAYAARPPGDTSGVSWTPLPGADPDRVILFCGYINIARPAPGRLREGEIMTQTGIRAPRGIAFDRAALAYLFEAFQAEQFFELPEGLYLAVEAPAGGTIDVAAALAEARRRAEVDPDRWAVTLSSRQVYVPILGDGDAPFASVVPPARAEIVPPAGDEADPDAGDPRQEGPPRTQPADAGRPADTVALGTETPTGTGGRAGPDTSQSAPAAPAVDPVTAFFNEMFRDLSPPPETRR